MSAVIIKPTGYGTPAQFWRLSDVDIWRKQGGGMRVTIAGYVSQEAYEAGAEPISYYTKELTQDEIPFDLNNLAPGTPAYALFGLMYTQVMADPFFTGAKPI